jgi:uncharacterized membrane protein YagU involved in acid resistance
VRSSKAPLIVVDDHRDVDDDRGEKFEEYFGCCCWLWSIRHLRSAVFSRSVEQEQVFLRGFIFLFYSTEICSAE